MVSTRAPTVLLVLGPPASGKSTIITTAALALRLRTLFLEQGSAQHDAGQGLDSRRRVRLRCVFARSIDTRLSGPTGARDEAGYGQSMWASIIEKAQQESIEVLM